MATECCVCYATPEDIAARYASSFVTIPCDGKHITCFQCFIKNVNGKCPMCRYEYLEKEDEREFDDEPLNYVPYRNYQDIAAEFDGNHIEEVARAVEIWRDFTDRFSISVLLEQIERVFTSDRITNVDSLYSPSYGEIVRVIERSYDDMHSCIQYYEGDLFRALSGDFEICIIVYISKIMDDIKSSRSIELTTNSLVNYVIRFDRQLDDFL